MAYGIALEKAWQELHDLTDKDISLRLLGDEYAVHIKERRIHSISCNIPAKEYTCILILHYLSRKFAGLPKLEGSWVSFKELQGGDGYYPAFKKRVIGPVARKYGEKPESILGLIEKFRAKRVQLADFSVVIDTFEENVPMLITLWRGDEEFGPEANMLFDSSISGIFCTEDIVVLSEMVAHSL